MFNICIKPNNNPLTIYKKEEAFLFWINILRIIEI